MTSAVPSAGGGLGEKALEVMRTELQNLLQAFGEYLASRVADQIGGLTGRLSDFAEKSGNPLLVAAAAGAESMAKGESGSKATMKAGFAGIGAKLKQAFGFGGRKKKLKLTNIVERADVGVPVRVAYNYWTQFADFPSFMKKVETVDQESDEKATWKAQVFWSHRTWEATIVEQIPDQRIVWRSKGAKGYVDGVVSFHELAPDLTRILVVLEYHPQGLFEKTGNLWRAQGRRARLELKHYVRHVSTKTIAEQDEVEGWRGEIRDSRVVKDHEAALAEEEEEQQGPDESAEEPDEDLTAESDQEDEDQESEDQEVELVDESEDESQSGARSAGSGRPARRESHAGAAR